MFNFNVSLLANCLEHLLISQVANGLWCVLVSDPSIGGVAGFDAAASLQVESVSVSGMASLTAKVLLIRSWCLQF